MANRYESCCLTDALSFFEIQLSELAGKHQVCGAQLAIQHGRETVAVEVGELEYRSGRPVTRDSAFPIGSISKSFTATLAMVLVADGDVELDAPLGKHLPELDDLGDRLTLRHLLSHTGGLACEPDSAKLSAGSLRRYIADHCHPCNLVLSPGVGFSYSNIGYVLVGRLIETITGMRWSEAMESILLRPLGIAPAFICPTEGQPSSRAIATGHSVNLPLARTQPVRQDLAPPEAPTGALAVSAMDLVALGRIHVPPGVPGVLPPADAEHMRRAVPAADPFGLADGWGLGLAVFQGAGTGAQRWADERGTSEKASTTTSWVGHDGNADGTSCYLRIDPVGGWVIALTTNTNTGVGMWRDLLARLTEGGVPVVGGQPRTEAGPPTAPPSNCAGTYANGDAEFVVVAGVDGRLSLAVDGANAPLSVGADGLTFDILDPSSGQRLPGRFQRHPVTGEINGIQITGRWARRRRSYAGAGSR